MKTIKVILLLNIIRLINEIYEHVYLGLRHPCACCEKLHHGIHVWLHLLTIRVNSCWFHQSTFASHKRLIKYEKTFFPCFQKIFLCWFSVEQNEVYRTSKWHRSSFKHILRLSLVHVRKLSIKIVNCHLFGSKASKMIKFKIRLFCTFWMLHRIKSRWLIKWCEKIELPEED